MALRRSQTKILKPTIATLAAGFMFEFKEDFIDPSVHKQKQKNERAEPALVGSFFGGTGPCELSV